MTKLNHSKQTHWAFWASGTLLSLASLGLVSMEVEQYAAMGIVALLFYWGTLTAERGEL